MKKLIVLLLVFGLVGTMVFAGGEKEGAAGKKVIGYYMDAADDYYKAGFQVFEALAEKEGWEVLDVVGQGTAAEQLSNVENFLTQGVDAVVVVQNSPQTSAECMAKAKDAGVPYFAVTHNPPNEPGLTGFAGFDWELTGKYAGRSAIDHGAKKIIMIEGKLGQGTASGQTKGFLDAYKEAGKDIGDLAKNVGVKGAGGADLQIVFWGSGGWFADPAKKAMQDAITSLGPDGFDGAYVQNDEMMSGAIQAMQEAGLDPGDYWLGSSNGKEKSWDWVEKGITTMDVSQAPTLEADVVYQQVKAHFAGENFKKAVFTYMIPFEKDNMDRDKLIPWILDDYMSKRNAGAFVNDIKDAKFRTNPGY